MELYSEKNDKIADIIVNYDVIEKKKYESLSITDELTQLYNRRFFNEVLVKEIN